MSRFVLAGLVVGLSVVFGVFAGSGQHDENADAHKAHDAYVAAINSNDIDQMMATMTDDIVFMAPNAPRMVGQDAVRAWAEPFNDAYDLNWEKTVLEFVVVGDWAFEQYAYVENDVSKEDGSVLHDVGKGLIIYHRDDDGVWRVARDAWNSDLPLE